MVAATTEVSQRLMRCCCLFKVIAAAAAKAKAVGLKRRMERGREADLEMGIAQEFGLFEAWGSSWTGNATKI